MSDRACDTFAEKAFALVAKLDPLDDEAAHVDEDKLMLMALRHIANEQCGRPQDCAAKGLLTADIEFARWCA